MLFMVIERFRNADAVPVYKRFAEKGRMMPEGLVYVDSWVEANLDRCFQLMECDDPALIQEWICNWSDLVEFEVVPITKAAETKEWVTRNFLS
jgi:hypothetical protein